MEKPNTGKENIEDLNDKLIAAVEVSDIKTAEGLLDSGADVQYWDSDGSSPVFYACAIGNVEMLRVLVSRGANVNAIQNCYLEKPLHIASQYNHLEVVKYLLEAKAKVTSVDAIHGSALHKVHSEEVAKILLEHGSDMEIKDSRGMTALHWACKRDLLPIVRLLVHNGARIDQASSEMYTPLHYAVYERSENIVKFLLEHKANVNFQKGDSEPPLHLACWLLNLGVVRILLAYGADANCTDDRGKTPLHYICYSSLKENNDHNSEKMCCDLIKLLLHKGAGINKKCLEMMTPLHYAARQGHSRTIKLLLKRGADVDCRSSEGLTALHLASRYRHASAVKVLVEGGADVNANCLKEGKTPLAYAWNFRNWAHINVWADYRSCRVILAMQIIKLKCLDYYVCKENITLLNTSERAREFLNSCENEVFKLKSHILYNKISFYDFLSKDENQLVIYTKNVKVMRAIEEVQIREIYPVYGGMIKKNIKKGQRRLTLLREGEKCLIKLLNYKLPLVFVSDVLTYLGNDDLRNLVVSCQPNN